MKFGPGAKSNEIHMMTSENSQQERRDAKYDRVFAFPFVPNAPFLYPLKTSENRKVHWEQMG